MVDRAQQALKIWKDAKEPWTTETPKPELCRPWSEVDYLARLKTLPETMNPLLSQRLAAEGFHGIAPPGVKCSICGVWSESPEQQYPEHKGCCPWKDRPFALLKTSWVIQHKPNETTFDHVRHALGALEDIHRVMISIAHPRARS